MTEKELSVLLMKTLSKYAKNKEALSAPTAEMELRKDLKIKSARMVDLVLDIEAALDIEIEPDDMDQMFTIGEALVILKKYSSK